MHASPCLCPALQRPAMPYPYPAVAAYLSVYFFCTTTKKKDVRHRGAGGCCELTFPRIVTTNELHHTCTHSTYLEEKEGGKKQTDKYFCTLYLIFETCAKKSRVGVLSFLRCHKSAQYVSRLVRLTPSPPLPSPQPRMASEVFCPGVFPWPQGHRATGPGEHSNRRGAAAAAGPTGRDVST